MKTKLKSKGYEVEVVTFENDGDNYQTIYFASENKEEIQAVINICKLFYDDSEYSNLYDYNEEINNILLKKVKTIIDDSSIQIDKYINEDYFLFDLGLFGTDFYTRVCINNNVYYYNEDIWVDDITEEFMKEV